VAATDNAYVVRPPQGSQKGFGPHSTHPTSPPTLSHTPSTAYLVGCHVSKYMQLSRLGDRHLPGYHHLARQSSL